MGVVIRLPIQPAARARRVDASQGSASILLYTGVWRERYTVDPTPRRPAPKRGKTPDRRKKRA